MQDCGPGLYTFVVIGAASPLTRGWSGTLPCLIAYRQNGPTWRNGITRLKPVGGGYYDRFGSFAHPDRMRDEAMELRDRFHESSWRTTRAVFGMGLDPNGELIRSVGSESAHAIAAGMALKGHVETAALYQYLRLPEVMSGHRRDVRHPVPPLYLAWSSGAPTRT